MSLLDTIKEQIASPASPFALLVTFHLDPARLPGFLEVARATATATLAEAGGGCHQYEFSLDKSVPGKVVLYEKWSNLAALEYHFAQPHTKAIGEASGKVALKPTEAVVLARI
jgi:quinol monooxygenase YgiN